MTSSPVVYIFIHTNFQSAPEIVFQRLRRPDQQNSVYFWNELKMQYEEKIYTGIFVELTVKAKFTGFLYLI